MSAIAAPADANHIIKATCLAGFLATALAAWVIAAHHTPSYALPPPLAVLQSIGEFFTSARKFGHLAASIENVLLSIALSFTLGSLLAFVAHEARWTAPTLYDRLNPFVAAFPSVGWTLLAVIWFGVSRGTVIFTVSAVLVPFAMINLREGLRALDTDLQEMAHSLTRRRARIFIAVILPALLPFAAATLRIMFGVAWKVVLTAELFGGNRGLGYLINNARQDFDTATIFAAIGLIIAVVTAADRFLFAPLERFTAHRFG